MPTGYTAALHDGEQTFEEYAMGVARGFGALITMRDDPADAEIPEVFEPNSYYVRRVKDAEVELDKPRMVPIRKRAIEDTPENGA